MDKSLAVDYEDMVNNFWGVPLATLGDLRAISTFPGINIGGWISADELERIHSGSPEWKMPISFWDSSRPRNLHMWWRQFFSPLTLGQHYDFLFEQHFPATKLRGATTLLRLHDPFGTSNNAWRILRQAGNIKHGIAGLVRSAAFNQALSSATLIANTGFTACRFSEIYNIPLNQISVIPYAFQWRSPEEVQSFTTVEKSKAPYYLMIAGLRGSKRPDIVINTWSRLGQKLPRLIVVGDVPLSSLSSKSRKQLDSNRLQIIPVTDEKSLTLLKANASAHIFCSTYEDFGRPVIEALLVGRRPLVNDLPVFREIAGEDARYFCLNNPESLEDLLITNATPPSDSEFRDLIYRARRYSEFEVGKLWRNLII